MNRNESLYESWEDSTGFFGIRRLGVVKLKGQEQEGA